MRFAATVFPGLIAGTFSGSDGLSWWLAGQRQPVLAIELSEGPLTRVVVQVKDPRAIAILIRNMGRAH